MNSCPKCGSPAEKFLRIEPGMKLVLQENLGLDKIPNQVCPKCYSDFTRSVSKGIKLRMEAEAKEQNRAVLWKSRVNLVKHARSLMDQKAYSEAAISYEKYLRILEIIYKKKPGELSPEIFGNSKRSKEMTVITSVYWDLLRIYDMNPIYSDRQKNAASQLAHFVKFSSIYPEIIKRAESFVRIAKQPEIIRSFLKSTGGIRSKCFIATAVCDNNPYAPEVMLLRRYKHLVLQKSHLGQLLIYFYYCVSPPIAKIINHSPCLQKALRPLLRYCVKILCKNIVIPQNQPQQK